MSMQVLLLKGDVYVKGPDFMCVFLYINVRVICKLLA